MQYLITISWELFNCDILYDCLPQNSSESMGPKWVCTSLKGHSWTNLILFHYRVVQILKNNSKKSNSATSLGEGEKILKIPAMVGLCSVISKTAMVDHILINIRLGNIRIFEVFLKPLQNIRRAKKIWGTWQKSSLFP